MWIYEKKTQYPVKIDKPNPKMATLIITQYGGPNGELGASLRYLSQRFAMPNKEAKAILNDVGTEELGHLEMVGTIVHQLLKGVSAKEILEMGAGGYFADHGTGVYPVNASGVPWSADGIQSMGDPVADLTENLAAEQKARATYENLVRMADDPDVIDPLRFLREREVVHYQRFGEALRIVEETLGKKKYF